MSNMDEPEALADQDDHLQTDDEQQPTAMPDDGPLPEHAKDPDYVPPDEFDEGVEVDG